MRHQASVSSLSSAAAVGLLAVGEEGDDEGEEAAVGEGSGLRERNEAIKCGIEKEVEPGGRRFAFAVQARRAD